MALKGRFSHLMQEAGRQADRVARMRDANLPARRLAGAPGSAGNDVNGVYGRWGYTPWDDFYWKT